MSKISNIKMNAIYDQEEQDITIYYIEDNSKYGEIDYELANVKIIGELNKMFIYIDDFSMNEDNVEDLLNEMLNSVVNRFSITPISVSEMYCGKMDCSIKENSLESIIKYLKDNKIPLISETEKEENEIYDSNLKKYTLGYLPEHRMFQ